MTIFSCKNWLGMIVFFSSVGGYKYDGKYQKKEGICLKKWNAKNKH